MKSTRMSRLGRFTFGCMAFALSLTTAAHAQSPEFDAQTGSARISGGSPYADYRVDQAQYAGSGGHAVYQGFTPFSVYGDGYTPPPGAKLDPAFRAAAGLGGPSYAELDRIRFLLYHEGGEIAGVDEGFTNVGAFIPRRVFSDYNLFAISPRLLLDNSGNAGFNLGAIHRFYVPELDRMFGHSYWWDFSRSYGDEIQGFGWSFETVGRYLSLRLNANVLVGESQKVFAQQFFDPMVSGTSIFLPVLESFEAPVDNYSAEVAMPAPFLGKYGLELNAGAYVLTASGVDDAIGASAGARWQVTEDLWVGGKVQNDGLFDTNVSFNLELTIPDGRPSRIARPNPVVMSLAQSVRRDYQVKVARGQRTKYFAEINPKDNQPLQVAMINPNASQAGNGSTFTPFNSLADFMNAPAATRASFDYILVNGRQDGTNTNLNTGITLTSNQHLIGNGDNPSGFRPTYTSTRGTFFLPGIGTGPRPLLTNSGAPPGTPIVRLNGNATEVANLIIDGNNTGSGIVSVGAIDGFNIHDNTIQNVVDAIRITSNTQAQLNCPGEDIGIIERNVFNGRTTVANLGASVRNIGGTLDLRIADNRFDPFDNAGIEVVSSGPTSVVNAVGAGGTPELGILRNDLDQMGTGIRLRAEMGGSLLADVQDNVVTRSTSIGGAGLEATALNPGSTIVLNTLERNRFESGRGDGARLSATGGAAILGANPFLANLFTGNRGDGFDAEAAGPGSAIILQGLGNGTTDPPNLFTGNGGDGFRGRAFAGGTFSVIDPIVGQTFTGNGNHGFSGEAIGAGSLISFNLGDPTPGSTLGNIFDNNGAGTGVGAGASIRVTNGGAFVGGIFNNIARNNRGPGIVYVLANSAQGVLNIRGNTSQGNGTGAIIVSALNSPFTTVNIIDNLMEGTTNGDGFRFEAVNSGVAGRFLIQGNGARGNSMHGINLDLDRSPITELVVLNNTGGFDQLAGDLDFSWNNLIFSTFANNNSSAGFDIASFSIDITNSGQIWRPDLTPFTTGQFQPQGNSDVTTGLFQVNGVGITAGTNPLQDANGAFLPGGGVPVGSQVITLNFNDFNPGETLDYLLSHSFPNSNTQEVGSTLAGSTGTVTLADGRTASGVLTTTGLQINQTFGAVFSGISSNGDTGLRISARNGSDIDRMTIAGNNIRGNGMHGVDIEAINSRLPSTLNSLSVTNNNISENGETGFRARGLDTNGTRVSIYADGNIVDNNGGRGFDIEAIETTPLRVVARTNTVTNNGDIGLAVSARDNASATLIVGDPSDPNVTDNLYDANTNAGVGMLLEGDAFGDLVVRNSTFSNTVDGVTAEEFFNGVGVGLVTRDNSRAIATAVGNQFLNNEGAGLFGSATGDNRTTFSRILYFDVGGPALTDANLFEGNGNGVQFLRTSNGRIGSLRRVNIQNNIIRSNLLSGVFLSSQQSFVTDFYTIQDNLIELNGANGTQGSVGGIHLDVQADAQLNANIFRNRIIDNIFDGILVTDDLNFPSDRRAVSGLWQENVIAGNGGNGINLIGGVVGLLIGSETDPTLGNLIERNALDGVNNTDYGTWSLGNNLIQINGIHGVDIGGAGFKDIRLISNHITLNGTAENGLDGPGDGVEWGNNDITLRTWTLTALGNIVDFNEGRGFDILNQGDAWSQIVIGTDPFTGNGTIVNGNGGEGIYVVNTASETQNQSDITPSQGFANGTDQPAGATHKGLNADGDINNDAFLDISIDNTLVVANGQNDQATDFQATGIVFRVGTTGGNYSPFFDGGFASDDFRAGRGGFSIFGGVVASITNTTMGGNFGDDIFFESFTSTVDPGVTGGTWNQTDFNINAYDGDPLARFDLAYANNSFIEDPTFINPPALFTAQGAYYDNAEGTFKSRLNNIQAPNIPGPFASATRRRNAQRQGLRVYGDGTQLPPAGGPGISDFFLYPGVGDSTFRIDTANSDPTAFLESIGFFIDDTVPLFDQFDADGVFYPIGGNTQDFRSPWGWGTF